MYLKSVKFWKCKKQIMGCSCSSEYFLEWGIRIFPRMFEFPIQTNDIEKHQTQQWLLN